MADTAKLGNIIIIDSDENISKLLRYNLSAEGFGVVVYTTASSVRLDEVSQARLVIVDAMEQIYNGINLIAACKAEQATANVPFIMCADPTDENLAIDVLDAGADDFVMKPFSLREMLARVNALIRRYPSLSVNAERKPKIADGMVIRHLNLKIDTRNRRIEHDGKVIPLTRTEVAILEFLMRNESTYFSRDRIYSEIWKDEAKAGARIVDTNISRLRKKLGEASRIIINRYGLGYAFTQRY